MMAQPPIPFTPEQAAQDVAVVQALALTLKSRDNEHRSARPWMVWRIVRLMRSALGPDRATRLRALRGLFPYGHENLAVASTKDLAYWQALALIFSLYEVGRFEAIPSEGAPTPRMAALLQFLAALPQEKGNAP